MSLENINFIIFDNYSISTYNPNKENLLFNYVRVLTLEFVTKNTLLFSDLKSFKVYNDP